MNRLLSCSVAKTTVYRLVLLVAVHSHWDAKTANAISTDSSIYWTMGGRLASAGFDGSNFTILTPGTGAGDFAIDGRTNLVYWNDGFNIFRTNLDGSNKAVLFDLPHSSYNGDIVLDPARDQLFFVDGRNNIIYRSNIDGTGSTPIVPAHGTPSNVTGTKSLWLDTGSAKLYWDYKTSVFGANPDGTFETWTYSIYRTNLDGSQQELLFTKTSTSGLADFEVDITHGKVYWAAVNALVNGGSIRRANLDGSQEEIVISGGLWGSSSLTLDLNHEKLYYTDAWQAGPTNYDGTIRVANLDGSDAHIIVNVGPLSSDRPGRIKLATQLVPEPSSVLLLAICAISLLGYRKAKS